VDGATKLGKIPWSSDGEDGRERAAREKEQQAESLRKMFLAMVDDIGVVLIKLADRLHNMRTLESMPRHKQVRISQQTMEIYAPLANRLGIWQVKSELEDLAFRYLMPDEYAKITYELDRRGEDSATYISHVTKELGRLLAQAGVHAEMYGRKKHIYSIYRKMNRKNRPFEEIYDVIGVRILVETVQDCYSVLGIVHGRWHPIPGEIDDYIATPKESMYQSLHTAVIGPDGHPVEIQIRTQEMHHVAEYGIAAHWRYKEGGKSDQRLEAKITWLRQLMDWRDEVADAEEFVESLKSDVFQDQVYCFTPAGDIIELPNGATPVDFAYRIHTQVGHQCVGATVNGQMVPLDYKLQNAQVVKIKTSKTVNGPRRDWLQANSGYVTTASAREKIRQWFRKQERDENIAQGKEILEQLMTHLGFTAFRVEVREGETSRLNVVGDEADRDALGSLIGRKGERLSALQHLVNLMLSRRTGQWTRVLVDVEDYRGRRERQLTELAQRAAERVIETGKMLQLEPMPALERRWIHLALRDHEGVVTQSIGDEPNRRVVVVPRPAE